MKYKILRDYGSEGYKFDDKEYTSVDVAVKDAIASNYGVPFLIVTIIKWQVISDY